MYFPGPMPTTKISRITISSSDPRKHSNALGLLDVRSIKPRFHHSFFVLDKIDNFDSKLSDSIVDNVLSYRSFGFDTLMVNKDNSSCVSPDNNENNINFIFATSSTLFALIIL